MPRGPCGGAPAALGQTLYYATAPRSVPSLPGSSSPRDRLIGCIAIGIAAAAVSQDLPSLLPPSGVPALGWLAMAGLVGAALPQAAIVAAVRRTAPRAATLMLG